MGAGVRPVTPDDTEFQSWKAAQGSAPTHDDSEFQQWKASRPKNYDGSDAAKSGIIQSSLRGATFGLSDKLMAGADALGDAVAAKAQGVPLSSTLGPAYRQNLKAREGSAAEFHAAHPVADIAADVAGGVAPFLASGGLSAGGEAASVGRLARMGRTVARGAAVGGANAAGRSDALEDDRGATGLVKDVAKGTALGAAGGLVSIPATALASKALNATPLPRLISAGAGRLASVLPDNSAVQRGAQAVSTALAPEGGANQVLARRMAMDRAAGVEVPVLPTGPGAPPPMALDRAGPNVEGLAEGIANKPGPGRAVIQKALTDRSKQMRPSVTTALEEGTGVKADEGLAPLQSALDARSTEAKQLYDAARAETSGQPINSETLDKIVSTKAGKQAYAAATQRQGNLFRAADVQPAKVPPGYSPEQWQEAVDALNKKGIPIPPEFAPSDAKSTLPDPETLHFMKQQLSKMAKLGDVNDPMTAEAHALLPMIEKVKTELPDSWQKADAAYAERSRIIDMMDRGRKVFQTPINPAAPGQKGINQSLGGLDKKLAAASPEERTAAQTGAASAAHARLLSAPLATKSPGRIFSRSPEQIDQLAHAFPSPDAAQDFQGTVSAWDRTQAQSERMTGNSRTALRGNEAASSDLLPFSRLLGRPRMALRSMVHGLESEYAAGAQSKLDEQLARTLTSSDLDALTNAANAGNTRARFLLALRLGLGGAGGQGASDARHTAPLR